jgi:ABC-2 type transport system ATP-binding protein
VRLQFAARSFEDAARIFEGAARDDEALTLQVPGDGGVHALRALLDRLDREGLQVDGLSLHTPDLDDVFLALTGHSTTVAEVTR